MHPELQHLVDSVATELSRPATVEDRRQRLVVYSPHSELPDVVRHVSILQRRVSAEVLAWLRQFELPKARHPVRVPRNVALGMLPRICVPIRHHDLLLGYLWLIDADESMSSDQIALTETAAQGFALALYREVLAGELAQNRETEAIRNLLLCGGDVRPRAARTLIDGRHFDPSLGVVVMVARPVLTPDAEPDAQVRLALEHALVDTRRRLPARHSVHLVSYSDGLLLLGTEEEVDEATVDRCVSHLDHALQTAMSGLDHVSSSVIGVGQPRSELTQARDSYLEADQAARMAASMPDVSRIARWSQLGIYRVLAQLFSQDLGDLVLHPGLERLFADPEALPLLQTLETYLDLSGNALATSKHLMLHRTSLYYRIQRFEHLAGANLKDGNERLCLHLGLKLARFTGRYRPAC
ncbi:helix-turn-helix domain-containing protein [Streptomyces sp. NBC_01267]|uniref:PucR family transcriptional regulator n=1 Tax=unclassified Streptomyces TaxID=2593676 RepID=UPI0020250689|nr:MULTISPECIES: helix-turn-helix domain-containing protein [unclassified Streptomyces]